MEWAYGRKILELWGFTERSNFYGDLRKTNIGELPKGKL